MKIACEDFLTRSHFLKRQIIPLKKKKKSWYLGTSLNIYKYANLIGRADATQRMK